MEKNGKKDETSKKLPYFVMKVILLVFCVVVVVQFVVIAKGFASLKVLKSRLDAIEEEKSLDTKSLTNEKYEYSTTRVKRSTDVTDLKKALINLEKRLNQSYQYAGRQPAFVLRGPPGKPGRDGTPGRDGAAGKDGAAGNPGRNGTPGRPGKNGRDGKDGSNGGRGDPGVSGQRGPAGPAGPKGMQGESGKVGVTYIRWGKKTCPNTTATLVYEGYVGGSHYTHKGGASNYVCLTRDPIYEKYVSGSQHSYRSLIYGAEYETHATGIFPSSLHDHDVPCAVCHVTKRASQMMVPGRNVCPAGWTREYKGYLMAERYTHHRTMYTCMDKNPDYTRGSHADRNGALFYFVEGECGSLPCKPYIHGRELTCAVCTL